MNKKILIVGVLCLVILSAISVLNIDIETPTFDKCENAKYFTNQYNTEYYDEDAAKFHNDFKLKIIGECLNG